MSFKPSIIFYLSLLILLPNLVVAKDTYPKLANYYLKYYTNYRSEDYEALKKWDLVITQNDIQLNNKNFISEYKAAQPNGIILAYVYSAMSLPVPQGLYGDIDRANLWLKNKNGEKLEIWSNIFATNLSQEAWANLNVDFVDRKYQAGAWDGVMYDFVDSSIDHYSKSGIDINNDGRTEDSSVVNAAWQRGMINLFAKTRARFPNKYIIMNGNSLAGYQPATNGRIFENFPTPWESKGRWQDTMYQYLRRLPALNRQPQLYVINATTNNSGNMSNYRQMRFGLASTLLGDGYFSFDFGDQKHEQTWWYDEYDVVLGRAESAYYNLLDLNNDYIQPGLWRRDFENGITVVNSTNKNQLYIFKQEQFEKIAGTQDRNTNDGSKVNYVRLLPNDGIIMRKVKQDIVGSPFVNGSFIRVFNSSGVQERNGFFAYRANVPSNALVLLDDIDNDGENDRVSEQNGTLIIARSGKSILKIAPFGASFKGKLSFTAYDFNKDGSKEIVVAPLTGGGPNVRVYSATGKLLNPGFFVFDKNFHGGVNLASGDINNDGNGEIIVSPAKDLPPTVKILNDKGTTLGSFLVFDKTFRGGVNVVVGDANNDSKNELVIGAAKYGPHVRMFDYTGRLLSEFMAYDVKSGAGVTVMIGDTNGDGQKEILAGTMSF